MRIIIVLLLMAGLCGCETMPRGEWTYQTLHAVDTLQTINGPAGDPCYREDAILTTKLIGEEPSKGQALAWGVGWGALHWGVSHQLEQRAPRWALTAWQLLTIGEVAVIIGRNHDIGIRPWGENKPDNCDL